MGIGAVPADRVKRTVIQPDGKQVAVRQYGDEYFHYTMTEDGFLVTDGEGGGLYYSVFENCKLQPTNILAHECSQRDNIEKTFLAQRLKSGYDRFILDSLGIVHRHLQDSSNVRRLKYRKRALGVPNTYIGRKKGLVILVEFPNCKMSSSAPKSTYNTIFNSPRYSDNNHVGSVRDYFLDQSYGQFDLRFDVVGPFTLSQDYGYYGSDSMSGYQDKNVSEMIVEACQQADKDVDYKDYDWDSDGVVDQVFIIYAGYGQATGGPANTIWPHESALTRTLILDGVAISQYACSNELYGSAGSTQTLMGIGVACHEFSHCLGLPDLYDTDYSGAYGMSYWDLMNSGSYNGPKGIGEVPSGYTAYERWFAGWLTFTDITESQKVEGMPGLETTPIAYRVVNERNENEFFTLENRQPDKWFSYVRQYKGAHGLLVTHIDYDFKAWTTNRVNPNTKHQRMSPIVADNSYGEMNNDIVADLFPGSSNITLLNNTSHAEHGGRLFNQNWDGTYNMNKSILEIKEEDGQISFDVIFNYELPTPVALDATNISENTFTARWEAEDAESFTLELEEVKSVKPFISEKQLIENIRETTYQVSNLDAVYCIYKVRANKGDLHTEWSNAINVTLKDPNSITDLHAQKQTEGTAYNLNGLPLNDWHKGDVFIRNNKKFIYR